MTKRVTVSIPDELHEKMEKWKDSLNYSGVFQEAITEVIDRKERFTADIKEGLNMEALAERFMSEEEKDTALWKEQGNKDGILWMQKAKRNEVMRALKIWERYNSVGGQNPLEDSILGEYFQNMKEQYEFDDPEYDNYGSFTLSDDFLNWFIGWTDAVEKAWDEINKIIEQKEADKTVQRLKSQKEEQQ